MTVIGTYRHEGKLVLFGDMLLTASSDDRPHVFQDLPVVTSVERFVPKSLKVQVCGLARKLCLIGPRLAIGWCGRQLLASWVIRGLRDHFATTEPSEAALKAELNRLWSANETGWTDLELLVCSFENGSSRAFEWRMGDNTLATIDDSQLLGSGADAVRRVRGDLVGSAGPGADAVEGALCLSGILLLNESHSGGTLLDRFGGGYQIIRETNGQFEAVRSVTYIPCIATRDGQQVKYWEPTVVLKYGELQGTPYIARLTLADPTKVIFYFPDPMPLGSEPVPNVTTHDLTLESDYYCHLVDAVDRSGSRASMALGIRRIKEDRVRVLPTTDGETLAIRGDRTFELVHNSFVLLDARLAELGSTVRFPFDQDFRLQPEQGVVLLLCASIAAQQDGGRRYLLEAGTTAGGPKISLLLSEAGDLIFQVTDGSWREHCVQLPSERVSRGTPVVVVCHLQRVDTDRWRARITEYCLATEATWTEVADFRGELGLADPTHTAVGTDLHCQNPAHADYITIHARAGVMSSDDEREAIEWMTKSSLDVPTALRIANGVSELVPITPFKA